MRYFTLILTAAAAAALMAAGCHEKPEGGEGSVSLHSDVEMTLPATATDTIVSFSATAAWTAITDGSEWIEIEPDGGAAGDFEAVLSVLDNNDTASRTAVITFLCGTSETALTITQNGAGLNEPDNPGNPETALIRTMTITNGDGDDTFIYTFSYDNNSRVSNIEMVNTFIESYQEITDQYSYEIKYVENGIEISGKGDSEGDYGETYFERYVAELDGNGLAKSMEYSSIEDDGYGDTHETEVTVTFEYDGSGRLIRETGTEYGYQNYSADYTWTNGDLTGSYNSSEGYNGTFTYSEYDNTGNIDINWILAGGYSSWAAPLGIIGVLGERSTHYVWPDIWDYALVNGNSDIGPVHKDLIGTTVERTYYESHSGEPEVTYTFASGSGSEDELLTDIVKSIPWYQVTYSQTYRYVLEDPSVQPDEDGYYRYGVRLEPVGDPRETGRESLDPEVTKVHIGY